mgnify:FL=1
MSIRAVKIPSFAGIFSHPTHGDQTFLDEISGRVRVIACLDRLPNVYSSDQGPWMGITSEDIREIGRRLDMDDGDAFVVVWGPQRDVETAAEEVMIRCREAFDGVPNETRQLMTPDTTTFERILPGPDRMYPDTDLPPKVVTDEILNRVNSLLPPPYWKEEKAMLDSGIPWQIAHRMIVSGWMDVYRDSVKKGSDPRFTAFTLMETFKRLERDGLDVRSIPEGELALAFKMVGEGRISRRAIPEMIKIMVENKWRADRALEEGGLAKIPEKEMRSIVNRSIEGKEDLADLMKGGNEGPLMGVVMDNIGVLADGAEVRELLLEII